MGWKKVLFKWYQRFLQRYRRWRCGIKESTVRLGKCVRIASNDFRIGQHVSIGDYVRIRGKVRIGSNTKIHDFVYLDARGGEIEIGHDCSLNDYCIVYGMGGVYIGNDVRIAAHTVIVSANHNYADPSKPIRLQGETKGKIVLGNDVWIGANCCLLAGISVENGCVIGAGSVVNRSLPRFSVAAGNPARIIKQRG